MDMASVLDTCSRWSKLFAQRFVSTRFDPNDTVLMQGHVAKKAMLRSEWHERKAVLTYKGLYFFEVEGDQLRATEAFKVDRMVELLHRNGYFLLRCTRKFGPGVRRVEFRVEPSRSQAWVEGFEHALANAMKRPAIELRDQDVTKAASKVSGAGSSGDLDWAPSTKPKDFGPRYPLLESDSDTQSPARPAARAREEPRAQTPTQPEDPGEQGEDLDQWFERPFGQEKRERENLRAPRVGQARA